MAGSRHQTLCFVHTEHLWTPRLWSLILHLPCCRWLPSVTRKPFNISALPTDHDMSSFNTAYKATITWPLGPVSPPPQEPSSSITQTEISPSSRHSHAHSTCWEQFPNSRCFYSPSGHHKFFQDKGDPSGSVTHTPLTEIKAPTPHKGEVTC